MFQHQKWNDFTKSLSIRRTGVGQPFINNHSKNGHMKRFIKYFTALLLLTIGWAFIVFRLLNGWCIIQFQKVKTQQRR
jgi:hypothetical protein